MKSQSQQGCRIYYNLTNFLHRSSKAHPECPERLTWLIESLKSISENNQAIMLEEVKPGGGITKEEIQKLLADLHGHSYWEFVKQMWDQGFNKTEMYINLDTYFMKDTYNAAVQAARTTVIAADSLTRPNATSCFALVRPPGHHSGMKGQPHGFSFFNNVAVAADYLIRSKKAAKIAIVDWDVHHGEGTQKIFYDRKDVLFISLHRFDEGKFFPHVRESSSENVGSGQGSGFNINICWNLEAKPKGSSYAREETCGDEQYSFAFSKIVIPVLSEYGPDYILVSCGFDSALGDPFGNLALTQAGYTLMTEMLLGLGKNILLVLEGGYSKQVLGWAGEAVARSLSNSVTVETRESMGKNRLNPVNKIGERGVEECLSYISKYWSSL